jgi:hypothetical protein
MQLILSDKTYSLFVAGYGSGKTQALCGRAMKLKLAKPDVDLAYYAPRLDLIDRIAVPRLFEMMDAFGLSGRIHQTKRYLEIYGYNKIWMRSLWEPSSIVGYEVGDSLVDEIDLMPVDRAREAWERLIARQRQQSVYCDTNTIAVGTTPEGYEFAYQHFVVEHGKDPDYRVIHASTYSNAHNLPKDYIRNLVNSYPPQLVEAYIEGQFTPLGSGRVYPSFHRALNHSDGKDDGKSALHIGMDFNVYAMAAAIHIIKDGRPIQINELIGIADTPAMITALKQIYPDRNIIVYPDSSGDNRTTIGVSVTNIKQLRNAGFTCLYTNKNPSVKDRISCVNNNFYNDIKGRFYRINTDECPESVNGLEQQVYGTNKMPDKKSKYDHLNDARGYFLSYRFPAVGHEEIVRVMGR